MSGPVIRDRQRPPAQPAGRHGRPAPPGADRGHRSRRARGKIALAFDTLYAEGQRRYIESLSTYAKQFLERMPKPLVDRIEGIAPAVAIEQRNPTDVQPLHRRHRDRGLRLPAPALGARRRRRFCRTCGGAGAARHAAVGHRRRARAQATGRAAGGLSAARLARARTQAVIVENLRALGFVRVDGRWRAAAPRRAAGRATRPRRRRRNCWSSSTGSPGGRRRSAARLAEALAHRVRRGRGRRARAARRRRAHALHRVPRLQRLRHARGTRSRPALFSFNNPRGACAACNGFGAVLEYDESLIVPDPALAAARWRDRSVDQAALRGATHALLVERAPEARRDRRTRRGRSSRPTVRRELLHGKSGRYLGIFPFLKVARGEALQAVHPRLPAAVPAGADLRRVRRHAAQPEALAVRIGGRTIAEVAALSGRRRSRLARRRCRSPRSSARSAELDPGAKLDARASLPARRRARLPHARPADPHALGRRGAAHRARPTRSGSRLVDTLYVLDEPSIGLHPRDTDRLLGAAAPAPRRRQHRGGGGARPRGDPRRPTSCSSSGPGAGEHGGQRGARGPGRRARRSTLTGQYLTGREAHRRAQRAARGGTRAGSRCAARAAQPAGRRLRHPARHAHRGHRRLGLGQEHAGARRAATGSSRRGCTASTRPSRTWARRSARSRR